MSGSPRAGSTPPHDGLRHPALPKKALAPNEMWSALLGTCGYVPLPLTGADYLELLPVRFHPVTGRGIRINYRTYDHAVLNEHRGRPCPTHPGGKWEVHLNPHDVRQVYIRLPDGRLHEIPWIHRDHVHAPMSETAWRHIRAALGRRAGRERHEADLAEAADQVLRRSRPLPGTGTPSAAAARHAAATSTVQTADDDIRAEDSLDTLEAHSPDADGHLAEGEELSPPVGRYALYDAFEEAEHW